jgi:hypothetical protein
MFAAPEVLLLLLPGKPLGETDERQDRHDDNDEADDIDDGVHWNVPSSWLTQCSINKGAS